MEGPLGTGLTDVLEFNFVSRNGCFCISKQEAINLMYLSENEFINRSILFIIPD